MNNNIIRRQQMRRAPHRCFSSPKPPFQQLFNAFKKLMPQAASEETGLVFQPFSEVQPELNVVASATGNKSFARVDFADECEAAMNEQINIEYTISYVPQMPVAALLVTQ
jgi:hypothetical protein